jgi:predicted transcriptional regulator
MPGKKLKTSVALDPDLIKRLDRVSRASRLSRSELITDLVCAGLDQAENLIKVTSDPVLMAALGKVLTDPGVVRNMVSGLRSELSDEQLELFRTRMDLITTESMRRVASESLEVKKGRKKRGEK